MASLAFAMMPLFEVTVQADSISMPVNDLTKVKKHHRDIQQPAKLVKPAIWITPGKAEQEVPIPKPKPRRVVQRPDVPRSVQQPLVKAVEDKNQQVSSEQQAKAAIAYRESRGSYIARNGIMIGKYQLTADKLHGDYSPANQERTADNYVTSRYGSWQNALQHSHQFGWY